MSANRARIVAPVLAALVLAAAVGFYLFQHSRPSPSIPSPPVTATAPPSAQTLPVSPIPGPERQAGAAPAGSGTSSPADGTAPPQGTTPPDGQAGGAPPAADSAPSPAGAAPPVSVGSNPATPAAGGSAASGAEKVPDSNTAPSFDVVRVEPTGESVIAGRAAPGAAVDLLVNGKPYARVMADASGLFAIVPPELAPGTQEIVLQTIAPNGTRARSTQSVTVVIAPGRNQQPLVTVSAPDQPTVVLSRPEEPKSNTATAGTTPGQGAPASPTSPGSAPAPAQSAARTAPRPEVRIASVDAEGDRLYVGGVAAPGSTLRLYLNDSYVAPGATGPDGRLAFTIGKGVRPGNYRVRLDDVDPVSGAVRSRAEVPFTVPEPVVTAANKPPAGSTVAGNDPASGPAPDRQQSTSGTVPGASSGGGGFGTPPASSQPPSAPLGSGSANAPATSASTSASAGSAAPASTSSGSQPTGNAVAAPATRPGSPPALAATENGPGSRRVASAPRGTSDSGSDLSRLGTDPGQVLVPEVNTAIVARGDNLWRISKRTYGEGLRYTVIFGANSPQIRNPDLIYPGQVFVLPAGGDSTGQR